MSQKPCMHALTYSLSNLSKYMKIGTDPTIYLYNTHNSQPLVIICLSCLNGSTTHIFSPCRNPQLNIFRSVARSVQNTGRGLLASCSATIGQQYLKFSACQTFSDLAIPFTMYWNVSDNGAGGSTLTAALDATYGGWVSVGIAKDSTLSMIGSSVVILQNSSSGE